MALVLAPIEGTPYVGGTATGLVYIDSNGLQKTDGPAWDGTTLLLTDIGLARKSSGVMALVDSNGPTDASPVASTLIGQGGSGTDIAGGDITFAGGIGTGTGVGGDLIFQYAAAGASSSTPNSLATAMTIDGDTGNVGIGNAAGDQWGDNNLIKSQATSSWFKLKGGAGYAKISMGNDHLSLVSGRVSQSAKLNLSTNATSSTDGGTIGLSIDTSQNVTIPAGTLAISGAGAAEIPLSITGAAAQSVDLSQWNPNGVTAGDRARVNEYGEFENDGGGTQGALFGWRRSHVAMADYASGLGTDLVAVGQAAVQVGAFTETGDNGVALGYIAKADADSVAIGRSSDTTAANQFVSGSSSHPISDIYFGKAVTNATPTNYTIHATGGSGTDIAGGDITFAGGIGTGSGVGGDLIFQYAAAGASSSTPNSLATAMTILGSNGNVGIGTTAPTDELQIAATITPAIHLTNDNTGHLATDGLDISIDASQHAYIWNRENANLTLGTNNAAAFTIDTSLNVDIGSGTLAISGAGAAEIPLSLELAAAQSANAFEIGTNGYTPGSPDVFVVDSAGQAGIGIASPSEMLHVYSSGISAALIESTNNSAQLQLKEGASGATWSITSVVNDGGLRFYDGVDRVTFDKDGNVGIGTTSPNEPLQVDDAISLSNDSEGSTARITQRSTHETHTLTLGATSDTTTISIPSGARLLGVSMNVNTAVTDDAGDDTWSAAFVTGSTTTIATAVAAAQDTKVNFIVPDETTSAVTQIRFTPNGGSFSAGVIEVVAYYEELTSLANV